MKRRCSLVLFGMIVLLFAAGCRLWMRQAKEQYALNRDLIAALLHNHPDQALILVNQGADSNTFQTLKRRLRVEERHAATGHDAFLDSGPGCVHGVFDARLLLLQFRFRRCAHLHHRPSRPRILEKFE